MTRAKSSKLSTRAEAIEALGLPSPRALDRLIDKGAPGPRPGKRGSRRYDVDAIRAWQAARESRKRPTLDLTTERAKLAKAQTALATLKLQESRGQLIRADVAGQVQRDIAAAVKAQLLSVPHRAVLAGLAREHEPLIRRLIVEALRELSGVRTSAQLGRKARTEDAA